MAPVSLLPRIFHWVFLVLAAVFGIAAWFVAVLMLFSPSLPQGIHFGPLDVDLMGHPGTVALAAVDGNANFLVTALQGNFTLAVEKTGALVELFKHFGLPFILVNMLFLAALFELLRRLFRNVGRGESFSRDTVRLVQAVALLLILFSFISAFAEGLLTYALFNYLAQHAVVTISGTAIHLPAPDYEMFPRGNGFGFGSPLFFSGLLVLALSEVFRQGLALKDEHALTISAGLS